MKNNLKFLTAFLFLTAGVSYAQTGVGTIEPKATLDVTGKPATATVADGIIAPRLTGDQLAAKDAVYLADQTGAQVYVTAAVTPPSAGKTINVNAPGYYYFDGSEWQKVVARSSELSLWQHGNNFTPSGNILNIPVPVFGIGANRVDAPAITMSGYYGLNFHTKNYNGVIEDITTPVATIDGYGNMAIGKGNTAASERLDVDGNIRFSKALMPNNLPGTAGQVLTSTGAGTAPVWATNTSVSSNIYTADGTLDGNRTVTQGANTLSFLGTGNVGIGTATPGGKLQIADNKLGNNALNIVKTTAENDSWVVSTYSGVESLATDATNHSGLLSFVANVNSNGTGSMVKTATAELNNINNGSTVDEAYVVNTYQANTSGIVRNAAGLRIGNIQATGSDSAPHNAYGVYIANQISAAGGSSNSAYAIYSASTADSYFAGKITSNNALQSNIAAYAPQLSLIQYGANVVPGVPAYGVGINATNQVAMCGYFGLEFYTQNGVDFTIPAMKIDGAGNVGIGIGTANAQTKLDIAGGIKIGDFGGTPSAGMIRFNTTTSAFEGYNGTSWITL